MRNLILIIAGLWLSQFFGIKADLNLILQDVDATLNSEYVIDYEGYISDDEDEGGIVCNFTIIQRFPEGIKGRFKITGASMGEFVVRTGLDYTMDFCEMFDEPIIMGRTLNALGFKDDDCPPSPGTYGSENYFLDTSTFPDEFPSNNYVCDFEITNAINIVLFVIKVYFRIF